MGFFNQKQIRDKKVKKKRGKKSGDSKVKVNSKEVFQQQIEQAYLHECKACTIFRQDIDIIPPSGSDSPDIYILGEGTAKEENIGDFLENTLSKYKLRFNTCIRCRPPSNRNPSPIELSACRKSIESDIISSKPKVIMGFGAIPLNWAIGVSGILNWRGRFISVNIKGYICWYFASLHPDFLLKNRRKFGNNEYDSEYDYVFNQDMLAVKSFLENYKKPVIEAAYKAGIKILSKGD